MTSRSLKKSQGKSDTRATGVGRSMKSTSKEKSSLLTLKVLNDRVLVLPYKELKIEGTTIEVLVALEQKKLYLADAYEGFYFKRPTWGTVVSWGDKCKYKWSEGQRVGFPRDGWAKLSYDGVEYLVFTESQLNATLI